MRTLRRLVPVLVGLALLASSAVGCDWPEGTRYAQHVFTEVDITRDIAYHETTDASGAPITLRVDVYAPRGDTVTNRPAIIWGFGGAWMVGDRRQLGPYAEDMARRGYVSFAIDYRIRPGGGPVLDLAGDAYEDTLAAVQWVKDNAATYGINPDAVITAGYSAGAINALNTAFWPGERGPATSPVAGAVAIAGLTFGQPDPGDPPILMFHGERDQILPIGSGRSTCEATRAAGNTCRFHSYPTGDHLIAFSQQQSIMARTADWIYEVPLLRLGYWD